MGISITFDNAEKFDKAVHSGLPEGGDMEIITKENGTTSGSPIAAVTFTVQIPGGEVRTVQAVVTVANLIMALSALKGRYPQLGDATINPVNKGEKNVH